MKMGWKTRIGLVLSAVWLCLVFLLADDHQRIAQVLGVGFLPLVVIWGIVWTIAGWRSQRPSKPIAPQAEQLQKKAKWSFRIRLTVTVVVVLVAGLLAANWQFAAAGNKAGSHAVAGWFGAWLVYGLVIYAILRAVPKLPAGAPLVLAALIVVGAVNFKAYSAIAEEQQALASLAKATPLINKLQSGTLVTDQEVRDAHVGMFEPLMLAQATYSREGLAVAATYIKAVDGLQPELMLTPASLASSSIRFQTRAKLKLWRQAVADYRSQLEAATARGKVAIQAAQAQMPDSMSGSASQGFDESAARLSTYLTDLVATEREASQSIVGLLDLMDANPGGYFVDKGPPVNLLFREESTLARYRELMGAVMAASQREQEGQDRLVKAQADLSAKLGTYLKR